MMDLGASFKAKTIWDGTWNRPRLDSTTGVHSARENNNVDQWWQVDLPGDDFYTLSAMTIKKREDCCRDRIITHV